MTGIVTGNVLELKNFDIHVKLFHKCLPENSSPESAEEKPLRKLTLKYPECFFLAYLASRKPQTT